MDFDFGHSFGLPFPLSPFARLIATLSGTPYGTIDTAVTFGAGEDFRIDVEYASTDTVSAELGFFGDSVSAGATNLFKPQRLGSTSLFRTVDGDVLWTHGNVHLDGKIRTLSAYRTGLDIGIELDGTIKASSIKIASSAVTIDLIGALANSGIPQDFFKGQILSIKFTNITTGAIRNFVFDSGSIVEQFARGSTTDKITLFAFGAGDWGRYTKQRNILHGAGVVALAWVGENVVVNGRFDADAAWNKGTGWTIGSGVATGAAGLASVIRQDAGTISGVRYLSKMEVSGYSAGIVYQRVGNQDGNALSANGSYTEIITDAGTPSQTGAWKDINFVGSIDNRSVQHLLEVV